MSEELTALSGHEKARLIRRREISPVDLVRGYLARIGRWDSILRAWINVDAEQAISFGQPRNPWNPAYSASSSSPGSGVYAHEEF